MNKDTFKLALSVIVSKFGDAFTIVITLFLIAEITGDAFKSGLVFAMEFAANIGVNLFVGKYVDTRHIKRTLIQFDLVRAAVILTLIFPLMNNKLVWWVFAVVLIRLMAELYFANAWQKAIKALVAENKINTINSVFHGFGSLAYFVGFLSSGLIIQKIGYKWSILIDPLTFVVSAGIIFLMTIPLVEKPANAETKIKNIFRELFSNILFRNLTIARMLNHISISIFNVVLIFYVINILKGNTAAYGFLEAAKHLGQAAIAFFVIPNLAKFKINEKHNFAWCSIFTGLASSVFGYTMSVYGAAIVYFFIGLFMAGVQISNNSLYTIHSPHKLQASIRSHADWINRVWGLALMIGVYFIMEAKLISAPTILKIGGVGWVLGGIYFYLATRKIATINS